jgi:hypothetical protein
MAETARIYKPPTWSTPSKFAFALEVIKNGTVLETVDLSKRDHVIVGRQPGVCDVVVAHESVSRQHAALQFGEAGELYIIDLGSTHGTKLNKALLSPKVYTLLSVGSVIQFGESSRLYIVNGPPELMASEAPESEDLAQSRLHSEQRQARKAAEKGKGTQASSGTAAVESDAPAWGFREDAFDPSSDDSDANEGMEDADEGPFGMARTLLRRIAWVDALELENLNDKDRIWYDRIRAKQLRINSLLREVDRIEHRNASKNPLAHQLDADRDSLSASQLQQLTRHEENIQKLLPVLQEETAALRTRLEGRGLLERGRGGATSEAHNTSDHLDAREGEVEDLTESVRNRPPQVATSIQRSGKTGVRFIVKTPGTLDSRSSLSHKRARAPETIPQHIDTYESLMVQLASVTDELELKRREQSSLQSRKGLADTQSIDDLDAYMETTAVTVSDLENSALQQQIAELITEADRLQRLTELTKPMSLPNEAAASSFGLPAKRVRADLSPSHSG